MACFILLPIFFSLLLPLHPFSLLAARASKALTKCSLQPASESAFSALLLPLAEISGSVYTLENCMYNSMALLQPISVSTLVSAFEELG